jgi:L-ascorbate metabolism protein UlaG (beta-lactamase superfamily)
MFSGSAFAGGWGLQYDNPDALETASRCTHLWISHFHPDHLHTSTLKQLAALSPDIIELVDLARARPRHNLQLRSQ